MKKKAKEKAKKATKNNFTPWGNLYAYDNYVTSVKRLILESPNNKDIEKLLELMKKDLYVHQKEAENIMGRL